MFRGFPTMK